MEEHRERGTHHSARHHRLPPLERDVGARGPDRGAQAGRARGSNDSRERLIASPPRSTPLLPSQSSAQARPALVSADSGAAPPRPAVMALWERGGSLKRMREDAHGDAQAPAVQEETPGNISQPSAAAAEPAAAPEPPSPQAAGACGCACHDEGRPIPDGPPGRRPNALRQRFTPAPEGSDGEGAVEPAEAAGRLRSSSESRRKQRSCYRRHANAVNLSIVAVVAIAFGLGKFFLSRYDEARLTEEHFQETAQVVTSAIQTSLEQLEVFVMMMTNHLGSSRIKADDVPGAVNAFKRFTGPSTLWLSSDIAAVSLVKRVPHSERAALEALAGKHIMERQTTGPPAASNDHADYFPIIAAAPFSEAAYLLDVGAPSEGVRRSLIYLSRDSGGFTYTAAIKLVQFNYRVGVALQAPLFVTAEGLITPLKATSAAFYGMVTGSAKLWDVLENARLYRKEELADIDFFLFNSIHEDPPAWEFLGVSRGGGNLPADYATLEYASKATPEGLLQAGDAARSVDLTMGQNSRWTLLIVARKGYISGRQSAVIPTAFLLLSLFGTLCSNFLAIILLIKLAVKSFRRWRARRRAARPPGAAYGPEEGPRPPSERGGTGAGLSATLGPATPARRPGPGPGPAPASGHSLRRVNPILQEA